MEIKSSKNNEYIVNNWCKKDFKELENTSSKITILNWNNDEEVVADNLFKARQENADIILSEIELHELPNAVNYNDYKFLSKRIRLLNPVISKRNTIEEKNSIIIYEEEKLNLFNIKEKYLKYLKSDEIINYRNFDIKNLETLKVKEIILIVSNVFLKNTIINNFDSSKIIIVDDMHLNNYRFLNYKNVKLIKYNKLYSLRTFFNNILERSYLDKDFNIELEPLNYFEFQGFINKIFNNEFSIYRLFVSISDNKITTSFYNLLYVLVNKNKINNENVKLFEFLPINFVQRWTECEIPFVIRDFHLLNEIFKDHADFLFEKLITSIANLKEDNRSRISIIVILEIRLLKLNVNQSINNHLFKNIKLVNNEKQLLDFFLNHDNVHNDHEYKVQLLDQIRNSNYLKDCFSSFIILTRFFPDFLTLNYDIEFSKFNFKGLLLRSFFDNGIEANGFLSLSKNYSENNCNFVHITNISSVDKNNDFYDKCDIIELFFKIITSKKLRPLDISTFSFDFVFWYALFISLKEQKKLNFTFLENTNFFCQSESLQIFITKIRNLIDFNSLENGVFILCKFIFHRDHLSYKQIRYIEKYHPDFFTYNV